MAKIKAVLDQETWVEVDVPDEFQVIITSLFCSESVSENLDAIEGNMETSYREMATSSNNSHTDNTAPSIAEQQIKRADSSDLSADETAKEKCTQNADGVEKNKPDVANSVAQNNHSNMKERGKSTSQTLFFKGVGFHMVNWLVILSFFLVSIFLLPPLFFIFFFGFGFGLWCLGCICLLILCFLLHES